MPTALATGNATSNCAWTDVKFQATSSDYFEAFTRFRLELEPLGLLPLCYGASRDVYPSGMARDMGAGLRAHKLRIGRHATTGALVDIFSSGKDVKPTSVGTTEILQNLDADASILSTME